MKDYSKYTDKDYFKMTPEEQREYQNWKDSIPGIIDELEKEVQKKQQELDLLIKRSEKYPDLRRHINRWKTERFCSASLNNRVNDCEIRHNCGCCNDSPLEIWPYIETDLGRIYSDPPCFTVGERHWISGDTPYEGWKEKFRKQDIPETIVERISSYFRACAQERKEIAEESDYDDED